MIKSFFKGFLFNFDQISDLIIGNYEDILTHFDQDEIYKFSLKSQSRTGEIFEFFDSYFKKDFYSDELKSEINALLEDADLNYIDVKFSGSFQGKQLVSRWNLLTAVFDYVKQFRLDDGVDCAFFYKLYKTVLKKYKLSAIKMI